MGLWSRSPRCRKSLKTTDKGFDQKICSRQYSCNTRLQQICFVGLWQDCDAWYGTFDEVAWKWFDDLCDVAAHSKVSAVGECFHVAADELTRVPTENGVSVPWRKAFEDVGMQLAALHRSTLGVGGSGWFQGGCVFFQKLKGRSPSY